MNASTVQPIIDALTSDGDEWWNEDETVGYRLRIMPDEDASINDYEGDGKVSEYAYDYCRDGHSQRPDGFTGRAMKIQVDRGSFVWWEPYNDLMGYVDADGVQQSAKWDQLPAENRRSETARIRELLEMGFVGVTIDQLEPCDHGDVHGVAVAGLWGIDSLDNGYLATVVGELLAELGVES